MGHLVTLGVFLSSVVCCACATAARPIEPGRYCLKEALVGDSGRGTVPVGNFQMSAEVVKVGVSYRVAFQNSMPDNPEILTAEEDARVQRDGSLAFGFEDGWGNSGHGRLSPRGVITVEVVGQSPDVRGRNIQRNYGTYELSSAACADPTFARG